MISITIPSYNRAHLISRAIKSVLNQEYQQWELLIVDDGSTDNTEEVVSQFLKDSRIKYIKKENTGAAHSRNVGIENSQYEWITFLDSDDEGKPNWLSEVVKVIAESGASFVSCGNDFVDDDGKLIYSSLPKKANGIFPNVCFKMTNGGIFFLKREDFLKVGAYDANLKSGQHTELSFRIIPYLLQKNAVIKDIQLSLITIHIHKGDRIRGNPKMKYEGVSYCIEKHEEFFSDKPALKSKYLGIAGVNAHIIGLKSIGVQYLLKAFYVKPSLKKLLRILRYAVKPTKK